MFGKRVMRPGGLSDRYKRPRAFDDDLYQWHLGRIPPKNSTGASNPAYTNGIFVVHGMGKQSWAETAAQLRDGFENVLEEILAKNHGNPISAEEIPPPFILEGFWADFDNLKKSFPHDWENLEKGKRKFFSEVWKSRIYSLFRTIGWLEKQLLRLVFNPQLFKAKRIHAWIIYVFLQIIVPVLTVILAVFFPKIITQVIGDLRMYFSPKGIVERAIVQRIDRRVGSAYLKMIGLDWDFIPLSSDAKLKRNGKPFEFEQVIWIAHSLGSVVSYNVLSDLFFRSGQLLKSKNAVQRKGAKKFRDSIRRFVTFGSPLDKIAVLFGTTVLRPWQSGVPELPEKWWMNFYHVLDPVSGPLSHPLLGPAPAPVNHHIAFPALPGLAHVVYWKDKSMLRYLLSRLYGKAILNVPSLTPRSERAIKIFAVAGYFIWFVLTWMLLWIIRHPVVTLGYLADMYEKIKLIPLIGGWISTIAG